MRPFSHISTLLLCLMFAGKAEAQGVQRAQEVQPNRSQQLIKITPMQVKGVEIEGEEGFQYGNTPDTLNGGGSVLAAYMGGYALPRNGGKGCHKAQTANLLRCNGA